MITREYKLGAPRQPGTVSPPHRATPSPCHYPDTREQPLSAPEIRELGIASAKAWECYADQCEAEGQTVQAMAREAKTTMKEMQDYWRHCQVKAATGGRCTGLRGLMRADFRTVRAHFLHLAGMDEAAFALLMRTGQAAGHAGSEGDPKENIEQCDKAIAGIFEKIVRHFATQPGEGDPRDRAKAYLASTVAWKERKLACTWRGWPAKDRWHLYFTLKNRLAAMTGTGDPANRNKSQRKGAKSKAAEAPGMKSEVGPEGEFRW